MAMMTVKTGWTPVSSRGVAGIVGNHPMVAVSFPPALKQGPGKIMRGMIGGV